MHKQKIFGKKEQSLLGLTLYVSNRVDFYAYCDAIQANQGKRPQTIVYILTRALTTSCVVYKPLSLLKVRYFKPLETSKTRLANYYITRRT